MNNHGPIPFGRVQIGKPLPVDVYAPNGHLLLRRGQMLQSEQHRDTLIDREACMSQADARAWQRSLERLMRTMRYEGCSLAQIAQAPMPSEIYEADYREGLQIDGSWLDLQDTLRSLLYQGQTATKPLERLDGLEQKTVTLLHQDPDEGLFVMFQALHDLSMGYCATHALLVGAICALAADKLGLSPDTRALLLRTALVMNIGMAHQQDAMALQASAPSTVQRRLIDGHACGSADILRGFGVQDADLMEMVRWHHAPDGATLPECLLEGLRLLNLADGLVAKMAPRKTRAAISPIGAAKSLVLTPTRTTSQLRPALVSVLGFYPPGTYVQLANGETAVSISRGRRATTPYAASIINTAGMPLGKYTWRDTGDPQFKVCTPVDTDAVHMRISLDKIRRLRHQHGV